MTDKLEQIRKLISSNDLEELEMLENGELEYWGSGNFDDAFESGCSVGYTQAVLKVIEILENN